jgi:hypothetical protein
MFCAAQRRASPAGQGAAADFETTKNTDLKNI